MRKAKLVDAGIDYIRLTSQDQKRQEQMFHFFEMIALRDARLGYEVHQGGVFGFWGKQSRHALWGVRREWALVQASGYEAKEANKLAISGIQASRIDIQATFQVEEGRVGEEMEKLYGEAVDGRQSMGRPRAVKRVQELYDTQTIYIGKRASDIYVRIYDKYAESGKEEFKNCIRFEVEIKGRAAKALWRRMIEERLGIGFLMKLLADVLHERGIEVDLDSWSRYPVMEFKNQPTSDENKIAWLWRAVRPTVAKLSGGYGWILLFSVLFDDACNQYDKSRIISTLAKVWGS